MTITRTETEIPTLIINEQVISDYLYQKMRTQFGLELLNGFLISVNDFFNCCAAYNVYIEFMYEDNIKQLNKLKNTLNTLFSFVESYTIDSYILVVCI
jgi:hypothetical protein